MDCHGMVLDKASLEGADRMEGWGHLGGGSGGGAGGGPGGGGRGKRR